MSTPVPAALDADDRFEIQQLLHRYAWALDTGDVDGFVDCFSADAVLVWDSFERPCRWVGQSRLRAFAAALRDLPTTAGRRHHLSNILLETGPDGVIARSYVTVVWSQEEAPHPITMTGWYEDELSREGGSWRIVHRTIRDWTGPVLARFPGQSGEPSRRPLPPPLAAIFASATV